jgi:hypothetical protein
VCRFPFSYFALLESFPAVLRASGPIFLFCAPGLIFGSIDGVGSCFHVLQSGTSLWRYGGRWVPFSCFTPSDMFSAVRRASGLVFGRNEGAGCHFHVLRSRSRFQRYQGRLVPFLSFALPDSFSVVPRATSPVFIFCVPGLIFGGTEGVGSRFHVLLSRTCFRRCRVRRVPFSYFAI